MKRAFSKPLLQLLVFAFLVSHVTACDNAQVYGGIGISSYGGSVGGSRVGGSISIGGRIR